MRVIDAELYMKPYDEFEKEHGFEKNGRVQGFFTRKVYEYSEPYTPYLTGRFESNVNIGPDYIHYLSPFANYLWNGKKFVDPLYQIGAFYSPAWGFWSRKGILKEKTDIDLNYTGSPMRGPFWINRMWADKDSEIIKLTEKYANGGFKNE